MTEPLSPPPDDQIISAYLDGEATRAEVARVESSPAALARLDELAEVRERLAEPVHPPAGATDPAIAAALDVFDAELAAGAPGARRRRRAVLPALAAAASVALVLALAGSLLTRQSRSFDTGAARDQMTAASGGTAGAGGDAPEVARGEAQRSSSFASVPAGAPADLGVVADEAALRAAVTGAMGAGLSADATSRATPAPPNAAPSRCEADRRAEDPSLGALVLTGTALHAGAPASVLAFGPPAGGTTAPATIRAYLVDPSTCRVLLIGTV